MMGSIAGIVTSWWNGTTSSAPVGSTHHIHELESKAREREEAGDLEDAMELLLEMHEASHTSEAVRLAHELAVRHPDVFEAKGCPVRGGNQHTAPAAVAVLVTASASASADEDDERVPSLVSRLVAEPTEASPAMGAAASPNDETSVDCEPALASSGTVDAQKSGTPSANVRKQGHGHCETPWERGWQGPRDFKPPSPYSRSPVVGSSHGAESSSIRPASLDLSRSCLRNFTIAQLNTFDGGQPAPNKGRWDTIARKPRPIYISIRGNVYDASAGRDLYGSGGKYCEFAGHDITRRAAKGLGTAENNGHCHGYDESLDDLSLEDLERFERMTIDGWENTFIARGYPLVGRVITPPAPRRMVREELRPFDGRGLGEGALPEGYGTVPIYMGVKDRVFDVSFGGSEFYTNGGAYECLAGQDASRVLAKMSMEREDVEGVLDYSVLTDRERKNIDDWVEKLGEGGKGYPVVGWIDLDSL